MRTVIVQKCSRCKKELNHNGKIYNLYSGLYFGARILTCPSCGAIFQDDCAIELSTKEKDKIKKYSREYIMERSGWTASGIGIVLGSLLATKNQTIAKLLEQNDYFVIVFFLGMIAVSFGVVVFLKWVFFWKRIYPESVRRMEDPQYQSLIRRWNRERFGKE